MYTIEYILDKCHDANFQTSEIELINEAYKDVIKLYEKNKDNNEKDYINHALTVAGIILDLNADSTTIIAAFLHNIIQHKKLTAKEIEKKYGKDVADIVSNFNKINNLMLKDYSESSSVYLRKILVGLSNDVRVLIIKLADRLEEMRTADKLSPDEVKKLSNDTMEVLIPIAHRLGINSIKSELENLCLKYTKPDVYNEILEKLDGTREELSSSLNEMKDNISAILTDHNLNFKIKSRVKSVYSIYNKLSTGRKWSDIYDILAMRIILPTKEDCYQAIGLIHAKYRAIPKRFKDYIAMPKENMYQSLHTSVYGNDGHIFEIQLRTPEMDEIAEHGFASHWSYKEHKTHDIQNIMEQKLEMFRNTIEANKAEKNAEVFVKNMEDELLSKQIYVYTPKGDVMELPQGSTPVDFAYRIHSDVGDKMVSAIVNDSIVQLNYELSDGDIIKINTNANAKPNKEWLKFCKTTQAKNKIKAYFSKRDRNKYIEKGKEILEKEIRKQKLSFNEILNQENMNKILKDLKLADENELYLSIGSLRYTAVYIINLIHEDRRKLKDIILDRTPRNNQSSKRKNDIIVSGVDDILVNLAKCCNPVPGDNIIGYITKGEGVTIHREDCKNIKNIINRLIDVKWNTLGKEEIYNVDLLIKTNTKKDHILDIVTASSKRNVFINNIEEIPKDSVLNYRVNIKINNKNELLLFIDELMSLKFVVEVTR